MTQLVQLSSSGWGQATGCCPNSHTFKPVWIITPSRPWVESSAPPDLPRHRQQDDRRLLHIQSLVSLVQYTLCNSPAIASNRPAAVGADRSFYSSAASVVWDRILALLAPEQ